MQYQKSYDLLGMRFRFVFDGNDAYIYVGTSLEIGEEPTRHRLDSYKICFLFKFCMEGKKVVHVDTERGYPDIEVEEDDLDREVIRLARHIGANRWRVWLNALDVLNEKGRKEALEYLRTIAISTKLRGS